MKGSEMVFVDTSVWIEFFRGQSDVCEKLNFLLDENAVYISTPIRLELMAGASEENARRIEWLFQALPEVCPTLEHWECIGIWLSKIRKKGQTFGLMDLLIAATTICNQPPQVRLWSLDKDFGRLESLGLVKLFA